MKTKFILLLSILPFISQGQVLDSIGIADHIESLIHDSKAYTDRRNYEKALEINSEAEQLTLEHMGSESTAYAACCHNRGRILYFLGEYSEAEKYFLKALSIREREYGRNHPDFAQTLSNLASLHRNIGGYDYAVQLYLETKSIRETTLGKRHIDYIASLINLGDIFILLGNYKKAESSLQEAKLIFQTHLFNTEHPYYRICLINLANLFFHTGDYEQAELTYIESIAIDEKVKGKDHPDYAQSLNNLAALYTNMGNYEKSESLFLESKMIRERTLGSEHPDYALSLNNLASLYARMGNYEKSEPLLLESKAIREKTLGKEHPSNIMSLSYLGSLYFNMGYYEKSEQLHLEAKELIEKVLGKEHPNYALNSSNLAELYDKIGMYEKAEFFYEEAKLLREKILGGINPDYAQSLFNLARFYEFQQRLEESEPLLNEFFEISQSRLSKAASFLSVGDLSKYTATFRMYGHHLLSFVQSREMRKKDLGILPAIAYNNILFEKGFLLNAAERINLMTNKIPAVEDLSNQLRSYRRRLSTEYTKPINLRKGVIEMEEEVNQIEKELSRTVTGYTDAIQIIRWSDVSAHLKNDEAAIEFVNINYKPSPNADSIIYAALILLPGTDKPLYISLFEERSLIDILDILPERRLESIADLYGGTNAIDSVSLRHDKTLYELVLKPIEAYLNGIRTVYFSPSGLLHRINLHAISISSDSILADKFNLVQIGSTRQIVNSNIENYSNRDALLFGGIEYDLDTNLQATSQITTTLDSIYFNRGFGFNFDDTSLDSLHWKYLRWTDIEIASISNLLNRAGIVSLTWKGTQATEDVFKSIIVSENHSPRIIHVATHGFFYPDPKIIPSDYLSVQLEEPVFKISHHPMIRSGLVLAGANYAWQNGRPLHTKMEDGILTAYEISQMDLSNTELVVLSACETGLGDIDGNEGVFGLQRAFKIAGVRYVIMSLWQVSDFHTQELMTKFYSKWLESKMSIPEAFRSAQLDMRQIHREPFYWAGFVLVE